MINRISLEDLKQKPLPNKKQKFGVDVIFANTGIKKTALREKKEETEEYETEEEPEKEGEEPRKTHTVSIVDKRETSKIDRKSILDRLTTKNMFSIKPQLAPIEEDLIESVQPPSTENEEKPEKITLSAKPSEINNAEPVQKIVKIRVKGKKNTEPVDKEGDKEKEPFELDLETATIQGMPIIKRLPKKNAVVAKVSSYYMNNRKQFIQNLTPLFAEYKKEVNEEKSTSCDDRSSTDFEVSTHQKVVRDYLNIYSPYRGLLLYHALGSGKTCTSIAIAEGLKTKLPIIVMTPRSLQVNFFNEMKQCGDDLYRRKQHWEFISTDGRADDIPILAVSLSLPLDFIRKQGGAWLVNVTKPSNYETLNDTDKSAIDKQIDKMIEAKYSYINYKGGLNEEKLKALTDNYTKNPFDNCVVLVDEAHNLISRIVNKLGSKKSISYKLYEYLMSAENCRMILLSGTPIINYPNEIAVLFNILRGYIKTWTFPTVLRERKEERPTRDAILQWFVKDGLNTYDYVEYSGDTLTITRNPFGFINTYAKMGKAKREIAKREIAKPEVAKRGGSKKKKDAKIRHTRKKRKEEDPEVEVQKGLVTIKHPLNQVLEPESSETSTIRMDHKGPNGEFGIYEGGGVMDDYSGVKLDDTGNISDADFVKRVIDILGKHGLSVNKSSVKVKNYKALPDTSKEFYPLFVDAESDAIKNQSTLQRRVLGLTSYFRNEQPHLLPKFVPSAVDPIYHIEYVKMSDYQFILYEKIRAEESKKEKQNRKKQAKNAKLGAADAEELFKISSTYRIASRTCCNFAFPDPPGRPVKNDGDYGEEEVDLDEMEGGAKGDEEVRDEEGGAKGDEEAEDEEGGAKGDEEAEDEEDEEKEKTVKIRRSKTVKVEEKPKPVRKTRKLQVIEESEKEQNEVEEDKNEVKVPKEDETNYAKRIQNALQELKKRQDDLLSPAGLEMYSPKFLNILKNIQNKDHEGLHLVYSQFRTLEGIAIFKLVLEANGFAEFKITKSSAGSWTIVDQEGSEGKPRFVLYTGTESAEEKEIIRNIYNSNWSIAPASIVSKLREQGLENNFRGETIKIFMITSSGAEGINLKNTRYVHIMEPYWHMVRLNQVIGRARRLCSHQDLPEELRTVQVFLYISVLPLDLDPDHITKDPELKKKRDEHIDLVLRDVSKLKPVTAKDSKMDTFYDRYVKTLDKSHSAITTDQMLFENALRKDRITSFILTAVKSTAMDCSLYAKENRKENLVCYNFGSVSSNAFAYYPSIDQQIEEKDVAEVKEKVVKLTKVTIDGKDYAVDRETMKIYDLDEYKEAVKLGESIDTVSVIGVLQKEGRKNVIR